MAKKLKLNSIRLKLAKAQTEHLPIQSENDFRGSELASLGIKVPLEHINCACYRSFHNNLKCRDHKQVFEYLNRSEMLMIEQLDLDKKREKIQKMRGKI